MHCLSCWFYKQIIPFVKIIALLNVTPYFLLDKYRRFRGTSGTYLITLVRRQVLLKRQYTSEYRMSYLRSIVFRGTVVISSNLVFIYVYKEKN